ncbi:hypothetical protein ABK040_001474 [Willaertia magna]
MFGNDYLNPNLWKEEMDGSTIKTVLDNPFQVFELELKEEECEILEKVESEMKDIKEKHLAILLILSFYYFKKNNERAFSFSEKALHIIEDLTIECLSFKQALLTIHALNNFEKKNIEEFNGLIKEILTFNDTEQTLCNCAESLYYIFFYTGEFKEEAILYCNYASLFGTTIIDNKYHGYWIKLYFKEKEIDIYRELLLNGCDFYKEHSENIYCKILDIKKTTPNKRLDELTKYFNTLTTLPKPEKALYEVARFIMNKDWSKDNFFYILRYVISCQTPFEEITAWKRLFSNFNLILHQLPEIFKDSIAINYIRKIHSFLHFDHNLEYKVNKLLTFNNLNCYPFAVQRIVGKLIKENKKSIALVLLMKFKEVVNKILPYFNEEICIWYTYTLWVYETAIDICPNHEFVIEWKEAMIVTMEKTKLCNKLKEEELLSALEGSDTDSVEGDNFNDFIFEPDLEENYLQEDTNWLEEE